MRLCILNISLIKKIRFIYFIGLSIFLIPVCSFAIEAEIKANTRSEYILCKLEREVRTIRVIRSTDGVCKTQYTKGGKDQNVGQAKANSVCVSVLESIRKNLESQKWKCKDISQSKISENSDQITF